MVAVSPFLWPLGEDRGVRTVFETLRGYARAGYEVHLVTLSNSEEMETVYRGLQVHFVRLPFVPPGIEYNLFRSVFSYPLSASRSRGLDYLWDKVLWAQFVLLGYRQALEIAQSMQPNLVYGFTSYGAPVAWAVGRRLKIPNVNRLLGTFLYPWLLDPPSFAARVKLRLRLWLSFPEILAFRTPARLLLITDDGTRGAWVAERLGVPTERVRCWVNGFVEYSETPTAREAVRQKYGLPPSEKIVVSVCQLVRWKRVDRLIEAFAAASRRVPDATLLVIGDGRERAALEEQAVRQLPPGKVVFTGGIPHAEVWACLAAADVYASAYDLTNACNTLFEAMRAGKPIITLGNGDTDQFLRHGETGVLVSPDDMEGLVNALVALLENPALRERYSQRVRQAAEALFVSWEVRMEREVREVEAVCQLPRAEKAVPVFDDAGLPKVAG